MSERSPEKQLAQFLGKFLPEIAERASAALAKLRARLPGSIEMVYDNYNALAIGFGPTERASDAIFSIAVFPRWISLFFLQGAGLYDPDKVLKGGGSKARHIVLHDVGLIDSPAVQALMERALDAARVPLDPDQPHRMVIKSISEKQRPRRPAAVIPKARAVKKAR